jgi:hypothetical protein
MKLVERFLHDSSDPTERWAPAVWTAPAFDWSDLRFGPICFGDPLERAEPLGRPDIFRRTLPGYCEMIYLRAGFQIDFDDGRFAYIAYFIASDPQEENHPDMGYSTPVLDDELTLTPDVLADDIKQKLGPPSDEQIDIDETVLVYAGGGIVVEFEFDADGRLKRWNLYPQTET